jgi:hypothetical protein
MIDVFCLIVRLLFVQSYVDIKISQFIRNVLSRILFVVVVAIPLPMVLNKFYAEWKGLFFTSLSFLLLTSLLVYCIGFTKSERNIVQAFIFKKCGFIIRK